MTKVSERRLRKLQEDACELLSRAESGLRSVSWQCTTGEHLIGLSNMLDQADRLIIRASSILYREERKGGAA